jgi:hypothetical protein
MDKISIYTRNTRTQANGVGFAIKKSQKHNFNIFIFITEKFGFSTPANAQTGLKTRLPISSEHKIKTPYNIDEKTISQIKRHRLPLNNRHVFLKVIYMSLIASPGR